MSAWEKKPDLPLKSVRANMKLTAETMINSSVCVYTFERCERALKNISDEIPNPDIDQEFERAFSSCRGNRH